MKAFSTLRKEIIDKQLIPYRCAKCGCEGHWQDGEISLELHHIDGNHQNNDLSNLIFLCPNCHALTDSYCKAHKGTNFDEEQFLFYIKEGNSICQALMKMGLSTGGANYKKAYTILVNNHIDYTLYNADESVTRCAKCGKIISTGSTYCSECAHEIQRIAERPDPDTLLEEIATSSFVKVGQKYGVSDKTIVKWCKAYGLPTKKKDLVNLYNNKKLSQ